MAIVRSVEGRKFSGKMNKKSNEVHRIRNGREFVHTILKEYEDDPSKAQKMQRSVFGQTNALVNRIMADPQQVLEWRKRMDEFNRSGSWKQLPSPKRFITVRQYVYHVISEQLKQKPAVKRRKAALPVLLPRNVRLQVKLFSDLSASEIYEILKARFSVFVGEQHIHYLDEDNIDYLATHFSLRKNGLVIAYARLYKEAQKNVLRIGRMLTVERGKGYGRFLMTQMIEEARRLGAQTLRLHAQTQAVPFYKHLGFHTVGDIFCEAEIPHVTMEMAL